MFFKVENEQLIPAPEKGLRIFIANPTPEQYQLVGYTDKVIEDEILPEVEGKLIECYYEQSDGVIYKKYRYFDISEDVGEEEF
jgi:hypothetical protein